MDHHGFLYSAFLLVAVPPLVLLALTVTAVISERAEERYQARLRQVAGTVRSEIERLREAASQDLEELATEDLAEARAMVEEEPDLAGVFARREPRLLARMSIAMQQVQLAHWIETGMRQPPEQVVEEITLQLRRAFCVSQEEERAGSQ